MISEILSHGAENARTSKYICDLLNISLRDLTATVERERRSGQPICASTGANPGYYLAANRDEMEQYCKSLNHREREIRKTRKACTKMLDQLPGVGADHATQFPIH